MSFGRRRHQQGRSSGVAPFCLALLAGAVSAQPAATVGTAEARSLVVHGAAGSALITVIDCADGRQAGSVALDAPLAAPAVIDPEGHALYAVTAGGQLLRHALPGLAPQARVALGFEPTVLAVSGGPDAIVLAGGHGETPLSAHEPQTLAELHRYRPARGGRVTASALLDNPAWQRFVVGFSDLDENWQVFYDRNAPPALLGLVHDYRNDEAVPLPGRLTARPFRVPAPTRGFAASAVPYELARIGGDDRFGVVDLDVRREIERPAMPAPTRAGLVAAWRRNADDRGTGPQGATEGGGNGPRSAAGSGGGAQRSATDGGGSGARAPAAHGWLVAARGGDAVVPVAAADWRPGAAIPIGGEVLAMATAPDGERVLVAHRRGQGLTVSSVDPAGGVRAARTGLPIPYAGTPRFAVGSGGRCVALLDGEGRWLAGFAAAEAAPFSPPGTPAATSSPPPTR